MTQKNYHKRKTHSRDEYLRAVRELHLERVLARSDFYPNRREALDLAIEVLMEKADNELRQE